MTQPPVAAETCLALGAAQERLEPFDNRELTLGALRITRALPVKGRRLVGPWCFLDRFGPLTFQEGAPMDVASHPHIGLQTVTWLLDGEVVHYDSLANETILRPGGVNVMTSGAAIAHAERTPVENTGRLNGIQLWTALPEAVRNGAARFQHVPEVPVLEADGGIVRVFSGALGDTASAAEHFSPIVGADVQIHPRERLPVPLQREYEHAVLVLEGDCALNGQPLASRVLYYLGTQRTEAEFSSTDGGRLLLVGGLPFSETILMWWNFVARTPDEIREAREDWQMGRRFGEVPRYRGPRLPAPEVVRLAAANPMS